MKRIAAVLFLLIAVPAISEMSPIILIALFPVGFIAIVIVAVILHSIHDAVYLTKSIHIRSAACCNCNKTSKRYIWLYKAEPPVIEDCLYYPLNELGESLLAEEPKRFTLVTLCVSRCVDQIRIYRSAQESDKWSPCDPTRTDPGGGFH